MTIIFLSCSETVPVPKPPTHLKLDLPSHSYDKLTLDVPYSFELPQFYKAKSIYKPFCKPFYKPFCKATSFL